ncbi:MAG: histidine kinase [Mucilaginibacter polytrichastri]|nr:histidine kinase [Mucilaginibacter polytrichastri]
MLESVVKDWKKILIICMVYAILWGGVMLSLISLQGLDTTIRQFGSAFEFYGEFVHVVIKNTIIYYILIFRFAIRWVKKDNRKAVLLQFVLLLLILTPYEYLWNFRIGSRPPAVRAHFSPGVYLLVDLSLDFIMALISIFIATWIVSNDALRREAELEKQKLNAELSAIKYQINPHFLFNSLSFIYTKTIRQNPEAAHAVHLLSEIMSYALEEWGDLGKVPLALEISHMKKVIEMNQIRFDNRLNIEYTEDTANGDPVLKRAYVPTLVLITLVENAFKHGELNDEKNKVKIALQVTADGIRFSVRNKKKTTLKEPSRGIGVSNIQQRLQLMYESRQSLEISETDTDYFTELTINMEQS